MKVTIRKISEASNYSLSTVSRALNNSHLINPATKEEIQKIALEMGYYSNALEANKSLSNPSKRFGFIFMDISNPINSTIIHGAEDFFKIYDVDLVIANSKNSVDTELRNVKNFYNMDLDGIIILPVDEFSHKNIANLNLDIPIVYICHQYQPNEADFVCIDSFEASYKATEYLINLGHKKLCYIGSYSKIKRREQGFVQALKDNNIPISDRDIYRCLPNFDNGYKTMESIILKGKDYTAIASANDFIAMGVMDCAHNYNYKIPKDFSIVGFDNIVFSSFKSTNLTTVNQPAYEIGKRAAEIIADKVFHNNHSTQYSILEHSFIIRASCARNER